MTKLQSIEKWRVFIRYNKMQQAWTFLVRQHILGVVDHAIQCFVGNLTGFPSVNEFWKSVKIWWNYRHKSVARFTQCSYRLRRTLLSCFANTWSTRLAVSHHVSSSMGSDNLMLYSHFASYIIFPVAKALHIKQPKANYNARNPRVCSPLRGAGSLTLYCCEPQCHGNDRSGQGHKV